MGSRSAHAAHGLLLYTANGSPYVNAVQYETFTSPSAHLNYVTVKGGQNVQIQTSGIIANIPYPDTSTLVTPADAEEVLAQTKLFAERYPQYAKLLQSVGDLWKRRQEASNAQIAINAKRKAEADRVAAENEERFRVAKAAAPPPAQGQTISGAFGVTLGSQFDPANAVAVAKWTTGEKKYKFTPDSPCPGLTDYFVLITPATHQVYAIISSGFFTYEKSKEIPVLIEVIKRKYPMLSKPAGKRRDSHGFYPGDIETDWSRGPVCDWQNQLLGGINHSNEKLAEAGERFIFCHRNLRTINRRANAPDTDFLIAYVDNRLKTVAKEEFNKLKAVELDGIKKAASPGL